VTAATGAPRLDPGVTSSTIAIGGTFPLTGPRLQDDPGGGEATSTT
jgi:hypothetical protein